MVRSSNHEREGLYAMLAGKCTGDYDYRSGLPIAIGNTCFEYLTMTPHFGHLSFSVSVAYNFLNSCQIFAFHSRCFLFFNVTLPRFELRFPRGQQGCKSASHSWYKVKHPLRNVFAQWEIIL
jgi:hypothetical protein